MGEFSDLFGQLRSVSKVYQAQVSCGFQLLDARRLSVVRCLPIRAESGSSLHRRGRRGRTHIADSRAGDLGLQNFTESGFELVDIIPPNQPHPEKRAQRAIHSLSDAWSRIH